MVDVDASNSKATGKHDDEGSNAQSNDQPGSTSKTPLASGRGGENNNNNNNNNTSLAPTGTESSGTNEASGEGDSTTARTQEVSEGHDAPASKPLNDSMATPESQEPEKGRNGASKKKDKSNLRKGKWTVEEEEYTSRVIQHFSAGLLTLPEGATLRSYLADKLNCDPMRITKKFTGACCLGRRVYHLRERPRATPAELEMAKLERDHLEQRFRMRIEHEQSGLPLSRRQEMLLAQPQNGLGTLYPMHSFQGASALSPWAQNFGGLGMSPSSGLSLALSGTRNGLLGSAGAARWLLPGAAETPIAGAPVQGDESLQLLNSLVTSWAVAQAAASIPPHALAALTAKQSGLDHATAPPPAVRPLVPVAPPQTLSSVNSETLQNGSVAREKNPVHHAQEQRRKEEEQRQLKAAFDRVKGNNTETTKDAASTQHTSQEKKLEGASSGAKISPAEQLQRSYRAHLEALEIKEKREGAEKPGQGDNNLSHNKAKKAGKKRGLGEDQPMPDEEAGTVLLGFLNSLRESYEEAVEKKTSYEKGANVIPDDSSSKHSSKDSSDEPPETDKDTLNKEQPDGGEAREHEVILKDTASNTRPASSFTTSTSLTRRRPASVTDNSSGTSASQQAESSSSLEDSSDKSDPSSSEDSDKETFPEKRERSKGPPRKRLKSLTEANVKAYNKQMDSMVDD